MLVTAASRDITPRAECTLAGFTGRSAKFEGVGSALEANIVVFWTGAGRCAAILTIDTLFVGAVLDSRLSNHFSSRFGQNQRDLLIIASHTHFAPALDPSKPALGSVDTAYASFVERECIALIDEAMAVSPAQARCELGIGASNAAINRRLKWPLPHLVRKRLAPPQVVMAPNSAGPIDRTITAWLIVGEAGAPLALVWHFACHPTGYPKPLQVSAEFPGIVRDRLRLRFGDVPVLFLQGFAGDLRPAVPEMRPIARRLAEGSIFGPSFDSFSSEGWVSWSSKLADDVVNAFDGRRRACTSAGALLSAEHSIPMGDVVDGSSGRRIPFRRLQVCQNFDVIAVGAEPLTSLRSLIPCEGTIATGYLGDVFGYWPSDRDAAEGGYEVHHFLEPFGLAGRLRPGLDAIFTAAVANLSVLQ